jgi:hypothetical protein
VDAAWDDVSGLLTTKGTEKELLLAAIEAVASIRPEEAIELLSRFVSSEDEDIAEAAHEAIAMAEGALSMEEEEDFH